MTPETRDLLRSIPSVSALLKHEEVMEWRHGLPRSTVVAAVQAAVDAARAAILSGQRSEPVDLQDLLACAEQEMVTRSTPSLRRVINATGIVLHTGLGRAPLCEAAAEALVECAAGYCNLEYDLESGRRGRRHSHVTGLLTSLTGAEAALVVNNNAAATLLILKTMAEDREVIVSRGQLVEIGGSYRLPDIMAASGATLREVGTTNRTRLSDYESAITGTTAALMRVHTSNYCIVGFTESVGIEALADLAQRYNLIAIDDLGSGALFDLRAFGLPDEPNAGDSLAAGADLVCFSGDKLLGGPQCGIILGRRALLERLESGPLMRTYRVDKMTLLALEATLRCYLDAEEAAERVTTLAMLRRSTEELAARAGDLSQRLEKALPGEHFYVCSDVGFVGGGSMPGQERETVVVQWRPVDAAVDDMMAALRNADVPVIARIRDDAICFDLRTIQEDEFDSLVTSVSSALWEAQDDTGECSP